MKEAKFMVWDRKREIMAPIYMFYIRDGTVDYFHPKTGDMILVVPDEGILLQYTGQKDKHGIEIYEWHILRDKSGNISIVLDIRDVNRTNSACYKNDDYARGPSSEIVGHVFTDIDEFPELLLDYPKLEGKPWLKSATWSKLMKEVD